MVETTKAAGLLYTGSRPSEASMPVRVVLRARTPDADGMIGLRPW